MKNKLFALTLICGLWAGAASCASTSSTPLDSSAVPEVGYVPPNFVLPALEGDPVDLHQVIGESRIVLVNFWATWCAPCRYELPMLEKLYEKYKNDGFVVLAVSVDETRELLDEYVKRNPFTFPVLHDFTHSAQSRFQVTGLPTSIILDSQGKVLSILPGYNPVLEPILEGMIVAEIRE